MRIVSQSSIWTSNNRPPPSKISQKLFTQSLFFMCCFQNWDILFSRPHAAVTCVVSRFNEFSSRYTNDTCYWYFQWAVVGGSIELTTPTFDVNNNQLCTDWNWINLIIYFQCRRWWLHIGLSTFISFNLNMCTMIWWLMLFHVYRISSHIVYIQASSSTSTMWELRSHTEYEIEYFFFCCVMRNMLSWQRKFERESQWSDMSTKGILLTQFLNLEQQTYNLCNVNNRRHIPSSTARCFQVFTLLLFIFSQTLKGSRHRLSKFEEEFEPRRGGWGGEDQQTYRLTRRTDEITSIPQ